MADGRALSQRLSSGAMSEMMAALGIPPEQIRQIVRNKCDKPIRLPTLLSYFRREIETGAT